MSSIFLPSVGGEWMTGTVQKAVDDKISFLYNTVQQHVSNNTASLRCADDQRLHHPPTSLIPKTAMHSPAWTGLFYLITDLPTLTV